MARSASAIAPIPGVTPRAWCSSSTSVIVGLLGVGQGWLVGRVNAGGETEHDVAGSGESGEFVTAESTPDNDEQNLGLSEQMTTRERP